MSIYSIEDDPELFRVQLLEVFQNRERKWLSTARICDALGHYTTDWTLRQRILYHCRRLEKQGYLECRYSPKSRGWYGWWEFRLIKAKR